MSAIGITGNRQQLITLCHSAVLLDDMFGGIEQSDICLRSRFLSLGLNPQMPIERCLQMIGCKVIHVSPTQSAETTEDEKVSNQFVTFLLECSVDKYSDFFFGQESSFRLLFGDAIGIKWVSLQPTVIDGSIDDTAERYHIRPYGVGAVVLLGAEK